MDSDATAALAVREKVQKILTAARTGDLELFKKLAGELKEEGKGMEETVAGVKDANNRGPLHFAAREGKDEICRYLVEDLKLSHIVDAKDDDGDTPLIHAVMQGHVSLAKYLVEHGADHTACNNLGASSLHYAAGSGSVELLSFLLYRGVDVDAQSDAGTPLIWAAGHGRQEAVKFLLENNANPNTETDDDVTPLLSAVAAGSLPCLELLIQAGANSNVMAGGATPLHIAADQGNTDILNCLLKAGSDPNITDEDGLKPVQVAAAQGNRDAVKILLPLSSRPHHDSLDWTVDGIIKHMQLKQDEQILKNDSSLNNEISDKHVVEVSEEARAKALEAKSRGEEAFKRKDFHLALDAYTQAIDFDPTDGVLLSNRSLCWVRLGQADHALADAKACRALKPNWMKACYREGAALRLLQRFDEAANAFYEGIQLDPENKEIVAAFREAVEAGRKFHGTDKK